MPVIGGLTCIVYWDTWSIVVWRTVAEVAPRWHVRSHARALWAQREVLGWVRDTSMHSIEMSFANMLPRQGAGRRHVTLRLYDGPVVAPAHGTSCDTVGLGMPRMSCVLCVCTHLPAYS